MIGYAIAKLIGTGDTAVGGLSYTGADAGGDVFVGTMPATPDRAVAVMPQPGDPQRTKAPTDRASVQLLVRDVTHRDAMSLAQDLLDALNCRDRVTLDAGGDDEVFVIGMTAAQTAPIPLGMDANRRHEFSVNIDTVTHRPTTNRPATTGV